MSDQPKHAENKKMEIHRNKNDENHEATGQENNTWASTATQQSERHRNRILSRLFFVCILIVLPAIALLPQWLVSAKGIRQLIIRSVPNLQGDVLVGEASIGWLKPLRINDVEFRPSTSDPTPIRVGSIEGTLGLLEIIQNGGRLGTITVEDTEIHLAYDDDHVSNLQKTFSTELQKKQSIEPSTLPEAAPQKVHGLADERVRIAIKDAHLRIDGPWSSKPWESEPIDIEVILNQYTNGMKEWALTPVTLLDHARLNPSVAAGALSYAAPILANTTRAQGEFSLVVNEARWIAGKGKMATIDGNLTLHEVEVGPGPLVTKIVASLPGELPTPPTMRIAESSKVHFRKSDRHVWHEGLSFGIPLKSSGQRLDITSEGFVGIDDRSIDLILSLPIPKNLPSDRPLFAALAGKTLKASVEGSLDQPTLQLDTSLKQTVANVAADFIKELRNKKSTMQAGDATDPIPDTDNQPINTTSNPQSMENSTNQTASEEKVGTAKKLDQLKDLLPAEISDDPTTDTVIDAVGGLLDEVAKRRAEREKTKSKQPSNNNANDRPARRFLKKLLDGSTEDSQDLSSENTD
jgi:hypothetical protein